MRGVDSTLGDEPAAARGRSATGWHPACGQAGAPSEAPLRQYPTSRSPPRRSLCFTPPFTAPEGVRIFKSEEPDARPCCVNECASLSDRDVLGEEVACTALECSSGSSN